MTYPVDLLIDGKIEKGSIELILIDFVDICPNSNARSETFKG
jgi:hypothetical protein